MKKLVLLLSITFFICCSSDSDSDNSDLKTPPTNEDIRERISDSLLQVYGNFTDDISNLNFLFEYNGNTYISGTKFEKLWLGVFNNNRQLVLDKVLTGDVENISEFLIRSSRGIEFELEDDLFFSVFLVNKKYENQMSNFPYHKYLVRCNIENDYVNNIFNSFDSDSGYEIEKVIEWFDGSYLIYTDTKFYANSTVKSLYVDRKFNYFENLNCAPSENLENVKFLSWYKYVVFGSFRIGSKNLKECVSWNIDVLKDIFDYKSGCFNCNIEYELISYSEKEIELNYSFINESRKVVLDANSGAIISNSLLLH
ncbi:hypothetical protein [Galbibacter mesophilus]|uniref:hypothetical protein n=1 Tax=Galbibacter mesophilus TaxID=379069 RepID=UPI0019203AEA|nr:hypothetical protein [Galbibacter mesophilus]MCM5662679.1 hypothetical protein [Galbibacter mesophilus]